MIVVGVVRHNIRPYTQLTLAPGLSGDALDNFTNCVAVRVEGRPDVHVRDLVDMEANLLWIPKDPLNETQHLVEWARSTNNFEHPEMKERL